MKKNKKRYWLEFGKIFLFITAILVLVNLGCGTATGGLDSFECLIYFGPLLLPVFPFGFIIDNLRLQEPLETYVVMAIGCVMWTLIGVILGWLYGKFKNRKKI